jgi:hypothetical protein
MKTPNLTKTLLDGLKADGLKATKHDSKSGGDYRLRVDGFTVAHVYKRPNGALRIYVRAEKLPKTIAKDFTQTTNSGYSATFKTESEIAKAIAAVKVASEEKAV